MSEQRLWLFIIGRSGLITDEEVRALFARGPRVSFKESVLGRWLLRRTLRQRRR